MLATPVVGSRWRNRRTGKIAVVDSVGDVFLEYRYEDEGQARRMQSASVRSFLSKFTPVDDAAPETPRG